MKNKMKMLSLLMGTVLVCAPLFAKEKSAKKAKEPTAQEKAMMEKWMTYSTPSEGHKVLASMVGSFTLKARWWMDANSKPEESTGTTDTQWILGGRFLESSVKGTSMGQPFQGRALMGYDNEKKQYDSIWLDTMATGMMIAHGQYDPTTKTLTETASASCPMEGTKTFRNVTKFIDDNTYVLEMYTTGKDGNEFRMGEMTYTRKP